MQDYQTMMERISLKLPSKSLDYDSGSPRQIHHFVGTRSQANWAVLRIWNRMLSAQQKRFAELAADRQWCLHQRTSNKPLTSLGVAWLRVRQIIKFWALF